MTAIEQLGPEDLRDAWELGRVAFGSDPDGTVPTELGPYDLYGVRDDSGRLVAKALLQDYAQWWGGREVPMGGVAGVAVHPHARRTGAATRLLDHLVGRMRERGQVVSVLFPTLPPLYRRLGWEQVGQLADTRLPTRDLAPSEPATACRTRAGDPDRDADEVHRLYERWARSRSGALTRTGRMFPRGPADAFDADVTSLAVGPDGAVRGYVTYDRGRGYHAGAGELRVWELVAADADAARALLGELAGWHPVAGTTLWRGPVDELTPLVAGPVPPPAELRPWMLRLVDPAGAVAARGYAPGVRAEADLVLVGRGGEVPWRLEVADGQGRLVPGVSGAPRLHERGLALLYAGTATSAGLQRMGLLDGPLPQLDAAFAGPPPELLDYF